MALGKFKAKVISAGIRTYEKLGVMLPQFAVKIQMTPDEGAVDSEGKKIFPFIREWTGTYVEGDNRNYTDQALREMGYLFGDDEFGDFDDLINGWNVEKEFSAVIDERTDDRQGSPTFGKKFEFVKSIWGAANTEIKNALAKDDVKSVMRGLNISGRSAMNREKIKEQNGGVMPTPKKAETTAQSNDASFAADDIPF